MEKLEKRISPRQSLQIPVQFHSGEMAATDPEIASETSNISRHGLFMRSPLRLKIGEPIALTLRVPTYLSGSARSVVECAGRVVHERRLPSGDLGYGVRFEQMLNFQRSSASAPAYTAPPT
jgi:PilZ domain